MIPDLREYQLGLDYGTTSKLDPIAVVEVSLKSKVSVIQFYLSSNGHPMVYIIYDGKPRLPTVYYMGRWTQ